MTDYPRAQWLAPGDRSVLVPVAPGEPPEMWALIEERGGWYSLRDRRGAIRGGVTTMSDGTVHCGVCLSGGRLKSPVEAPPTFDHALAWVVSHLWGIQ